MRTTIATLALVAIIVATYWHGTEGALHYDDTPVIVAKTRTDFWSSRPLAMASIWLDEQLGASPEAPAQYLRTNIAIHCVTALAVWWLLVLVVRDRRAAWLGAALWAVHPIQSQAVVYAVQRMASLATLGVVVCVAAVIMARRSGWRWWILAAAASAVAIASKETGWLCVPLGLIAQWRWSSGYPRLRWKALAVALGVVAWLAVGWHYSGMATNQPFTVWERVAAQPEVIATYASIIVWPSPDRLALWHDVPLNWTWVSTAVVCCVLGWLWLAWRTPSPVLWMGLMWVPISMAIECGPIPLDLAYEHRMYMPTVGLAILAGWLLSWRGWRTYAAVGVAMALLMLSTSARVEDWRTRLTLWQANADTYPGSARALGGECIEYLAVGRNQDAMESCTRAVIIEPNAIPDNWHNLAVSYVRQGQLGPARAANAATLKRSPTHPEALSMHEQLYDEPEHALHGCGGVE